MVVRSGRFLAASGILVLGGLAAWQCSKPAAAPAAAEPDLMPVVTIKELMESIIDPIADNVFDAVATDVDRQGIVDTKPTTDDDWAKVRIGAVTLAEGSNLLKMVRPVAPPGDKNNSGGPNAPEYRRSRFRRRSTATGRCGTSTRTNCGTKPIRILEIVKAKKCRRPVRRGKPARQGLRELPPRILVSRRQEGRARRRAEAGDVAVAEVMSMDNFCPGPYLMG